MATNSLIDTIKEISDVPTKLSKLLLPATYVCATCGKRIKGEIPFQVHVQGECPGKTKGKPTPPPAPPPVAPEELKRILRAKAMKRGV